MHPLRTPSGPDQSGAKLVALARVRGQSREIAQDSLALEEPLEIRLEYGPAASRAKFSVSITMRTPGFDFELAVGFLFTEGILRSPEELAEIVYCGPVLRPQAQTNTVRVGLRAGVSVDRERLRRNFYTSSSCGICGKTSIEAIRTQSVYSFSNGPLLLPEVIHQLPERLRRAQDLFETTGGLHASGLFSAKGELLLLREDVGRHNALDKVIGRAFLGGELPLRQSILLVSGRASFELVQKAAMAGLPVLAAVGAPSSLAVELAQETGITLLGFVREDRFNIYSHPSRIARAREENP